MAEAARLMKKRKSLVGVLIGQGVLTPSGMEAVLRRDDTQQQSLGPALVAEGVISAEQLSRAVAEQFGLPYEPLTDFRVDRPFDRTIPAELMPRHPFVPVAGRDGPRVVGLPGCQ